jgi:hypothetical protein
LDRFRNGRGEDILQVEGGFEVVCEGEIEAGRDSDAEALFEDRGAQRSVAAAGRAQR